MGRSRINWTIGVFAPWCLGVALLVSTMANADQDLSMGASVVPMRYFAALSPADLVPESGVAVDGGFDIAGRPQDAVIREAALTIGTADDWSQVPNELEPRRVLKTSEGAHPVFPQPNRTDKGDPFVPLRPGFNAGLILPGGVAAAQREATMFSDDDSLAFDGFEADDGAAPGPDSVATFVPDPSGREPTTAASIAAASPTADDGSPAQPTSTSLRFLAGATPAVPSAVALSSTTPAAASETPIEVVAFGAPPSAATLTGRSEPGVSLVRRTPDRPDYASLVDQNRQASEQRCLAEAVYFEARSEPETGQAAVAQVVLNRVASGLYPPTICGVVFQNHTWHDACQFTFTCDGHSLRIAEPEAWRTATRIADNVLDGTTYVSRVGAATNYHANYVRPRWARYLKKVDVIGHHIFYELPPGQG